MQDTWHATMDAELAVLQSANTAEAPLRATLDSIEAEIAALRLQKARLDQQLMAANEKVAKANAHQFCTASCDVRLSTARVDGAVVVRLAIAVPIHGILKLGSDEFFACFGHTYTNEDISLRTPLNSLRQLKTVCKSWRREARRVLCSASWQANHHRLVDLLELDCPDAGVLLRIRQHPGEVSIPNWLNGRTPLHVAANGGREAVVEALLAIDSGPAMMEDTKDVKCFRGHLPLHMALFRGPRCSASLVERLIAAAPQSVHAWSSYTGDDDDSGRFDPEGRAGRLPLHCAVVCGAPLEVVRLLIAQNARGKSSAAAWEGQKWRQPLHLAAAAAGRASADVLRALIEASPRSSRLFDGCYGHEIEFVGLSSDVYEVCDEPDDCKLPLHLAVNAGHGREALEVLIEAHEGALRTPDGKGRLPIHIAIISRHTNSETVSALLSRWPESARQPGGPRTYGDPWPCPLELAAKRKAPPRVMRALTAAARFQGPEISFQHPYSLNLSDEDFEALQGLP